MVRPENYPDISVRSIFTEKSLEYLLGTKNRVKGKIPTQPFWGGRIFWEAGRGGIHEGWGYTRGERIGREVGEKEIGGQIISLN